MHWLDKLNLQPHERRWLLIGLVVLTLVLNYWLVWPYFGEWTEVRVDREKLDATRTRYLGEIGKKATYERKLKELQRAGAEVMQEDQANRLQSTIQTEAATSGVTWSNLRPLIVPARVAGQTNAFFDEQQMTMDVNSGEQELVNFLYALGSGDSMIRVRDMTRLRLDPSNTRLATTLTVIASFQKKPKTTPAVQPSRSAAVQPKGPPATNARVAVSQKK
ncbi:MAG TPA: hypothetical protein DCE44_21750 [Verrucomicrobiales bacterium]|nr:hypothetical protein [Verrucomicrobiales bacterium]